VYIILESIFLTLLKYAFEEPPPGIIPGEGWPLFLSISPKCRKQGHLTFQESIKDKTQTDCLEKKDRLGGTVLFSLSKSISVLICPALCSGKLTYNPTSFVSCPSFWLELVNGR
jgi:hypothetical protein